MKGNSSLRNAFEKYWSLIGMMIAVIALLWMLVERHSFSRYKYWYLWTLIPILMLHNFEESFFPGNFLSWFNGTCFQSDEDYSPCSRMSSAVFAMITCWGLNLLAAVVAPCFIFLAVIMNFFLLQNAWMHIAYTLSTLKYSPGAITGFFILVPFCSFILYSLFTDSVIGGLTLLGGYCLGSLMHYSMFAMLRYKQRMSLNGRRIQG